MFEVGCRAGANLFLFLNDGFKIGGMDYSEKLVSILKNVFDKVNLEECVCGEAVELPILLQYDAVFSDSVFQYFDDYDYAEKVLDKMTLKSKKSVGILDIYDIDKKNDYIKWRTENTENYSERYKDLPKLFYSKDFFKDFADKKGFKIKFVDIKMQGYWNSEFTFNCFMYK